MESGIAAINCGADAVYIGAPKYGARSAAGNSLKEIEKVINYAHRYWAKTYVTLNTLLYDNELAEAESLIKTLYDTGADAIIIQDLGILEMNLPPIPIIASTQTHNNTLDKIQFFENCGFNRVILARELSLEQIKEIKTNTNIELECFIHGALCVSYSGQCYFSYTTNGRSANRGECAQSCRMLYSLVDAEGKTIVKDKYLLSLKDLNLSSRLKDLINAGITSFKIEGRLKDINYVKNVTGFYRQKIDEILNGNPELSKSSSGKVKLFFTPDVDRSFNRGFTDYFVSGKNKSLASYNTPKSLGKLVGTVTNVFNDHYEIKTNDILNNGDGLCYFNEKNDLEGFSVNKVDRNKIYPNEMKNIPKATEIYRNNDHSFENLLSGKYAERKIGCTIYLYETDSAIMVKAHDDDNNEVEFEWTTEKTAANNPEAADYNLEKNIYKTGNTIFNIKKIDIKFEKPYFFSFGKINFMRRKLIDKLEKERIKNRPKETRIDAGNAKPSVGDSLDYRYNVTNKKAAEFYSHMGARNIEKGIELQNNFADKVIMTCKYCIKNELDICPLENNLRSEYKEPFYLVDRSRKYELIFDCGKCEMSIIY